MDFAFITDLTEWKDSRFLCQKFTKEGEEDVSGELNDEYLVSHALYAGIVICAWGKNGKHLFRGIRVKRELISNGVDLKCLRLLKDGQPGHPLYIPSNTQPIPFPLT